ncbi:MAG: hypothetical protein JWM21_1246 [Acidobacteria bacterium]|nr:hypothetical protein [Acidobacteriota bacterium]
MGASRTSKADSAHLGDPLTSTGDSKCIDTASLHSLLRSMADEGDIILPLELCLLRRGETFKQWSARAKRCSIEAARRAMGGTMQSAAERLGLTRNSLLNHLQRAKRAQNEALFDWQREPKSDSSDRSSFNDPVKQGSR